MNIYPNHCPQGYYVYYYLRNIQSARGDVGTPYYIGKGSGKRAWCYHTRTVKVPKNKACIVIISENLTEEQAFKIESVHIKFWGRIDLNTGILHNKTNGGDGASGTVRTQATRDKIRNSLKSKSGRKHSEETKQLIAEANKKRVLTPESKTKMLANLAKGRGRKTEDVKRKISQSLQGGKLSESHIESLKKAWLTRDRTPYNKGITTPRVSCRYCRGCFAITHLTPHQQYHCRAV